MEVKKRLARTITADFHGDEAAQSADENWAKMFQQKNESEDLEEVNVGFADVAGPAKSGPSETDPSEVWQVRLPKLLVQIGLAASGAEANRKIAEKAVKVNGVVAPTPMFWILEALPVRLVIRLGKRAKVAVIR
jgi:tyrosyl-tRNA synthetase